MKLELKARVNRSDARTIRHALKQLSIVPFNSYSSVNGPMTCLDFGSQGCADGLVPRLAKGARHEAPTGYQRQAWD
jgi:hypothetical protein